MADPASLPQRAPRTARRWRVGLPALVLVAATVVSGCAAKETTTTAAPATTAPGGPSSSAGSAPTSAPATSAPATSAPKKELGNADIKAALSASAPELWALVDYDYMSWNAFGGFVVPVPTGTEVAKAVALCDAVAALVYEQSPDTPIVIAVDVSIDNIKGTPIVQRENKAGTCAAV